MVMVSALPPPLIIEKFIDLGGKMIMCDLCQFHKSISKARESALK